MKPKPLKIDQIGEGYDIEEISCAVRWLRLEIDNLSLKIQWGENETCNQCEEYIRKKIDEAFPIFKEKER